MLDDTLLDDPRRLADADTGRPAARRRAGGRAGPGHRRGAPPSSASTGSSPERPRALVLITRPGARLGRRRACVHGAARPGAARCRSWSPTSVPPWVGALDVVLAHTEDPGDQVLAESIDRAARRGARRAADRAGRTGRSPPRPPAQAVLIPPRVPVPPGFGFPRALAGVAGRR